MSDVNAHGPVPDLAAQGPAPLPSAAVLAELEALREGDLPTHGGRTLAYVYDSGIAEADELGRRALAMYGATTGLDPTAFPSLLRMESELVATARRMFHGSDQVVGTVTSGGFAPTVGAPIAMGWVDAAQAAVDTALEIEVRGKRIAAKVAPMPFVPHRYHRQKKA